MKETNTLSVLTLDVTVLTDPFLFACWYEHMPEERQRKTDAFRNDADKRLSLGAGILLQLGLEERGITACQFLESPFGKPLAADAAGNLLPVQFNLSHSGSVVAAVFSDQPVGIDIQTFRSFSDRLIRKVFRPEEIARKPQTASREEENRFYTSLWAAKESVLKQLGSGMLPPLAVALPETPKSPLGLFPEAKDLERLAPLAIDWKIPRYITSCTMDASALSVCCLEPLGSMQPVWIREELLKV